MMEKDGDPNQPQNHHNEPTLADELGIEDLSDPVFGGRGRLFSAAGRESPVAELTEEYLILHPPQLPFDEGSFADELQSEQSSRGVLLDNFGNEKKLVGARYHGNSLYCLNRRDELSKKLLVAWFSDNDDQGDKPHFLIFEERMLTYDVAIKLRNRTHDGELSIYPGLSVAD